MIPYWVFFLFPAIAALGATGVTPFNFDGTRRVSPNAASVLVIVALIVIIGFRFEVGGDWYNYYLRYYLPAFSQTYSDLLEIDDPGFVALNILSIQLGWGMTGVNLLGSLALATGVVLFCRSLPRPWLALACAFPYLIVVVGMGYTRQGIALGFVMIGLVALRQQRFLSFALLVAVGALFHKSAVLVIPIAIFASSQFRLQAIGIIGIITYAAYEVALGDSANRLIDVYITQQLTDSQGAFIRLAMNAAPAALFLVYKDRFIMGETERRLWRAMSWIALVMFAALMTTGFSTALDRMALYLIPLQLFVFSHLPDALGRAHGQNTAVVGGILLYYALVQFVWLNFATHSLYWIPYRMGLLLN